MWCTFPLLLPSRSVTPPSVPLYSCFILVIFFTSHYNLALYFPCPLDSHQNLLPLTNKATRYRNQTTKSKTIRKEAQRQLFKYETITCLYKDIKKRYGTRMIELSSQKSNDWSIISLFASHKCLLLLTRFHNLERKKWQVVVELLWSAHKEHSIW